VDPQRYNHLNSITAGIAARHVGIDTMKSKKINTGRKVTKTAFIKPVPLHENKAYGQLVLLGFDVTAFTPAAYQGRRLQPPLKEISS
jgi:hypothetical protein